FGGFAGGHGGHPLRASVGAEFLPHRLQFPEATHIALAPGSDAVTKPVFLAHDLAAELVLLALLFFENGIAPFLEMLEALVEPHCRAALEPYGRPADTLQESAVMRDDD